jgi:hypothetical protein
MTTDSMNQQQKVTILRTLPAAWMDPLVGMVANSESLLTCKISVAIVYYCSIDME